LKKGKVIQILIGHTGWVSKVDYSPDGRQLVTGGGDWAIFIWKRVEIALQVERWVIQYRLSRDFVLLAQEAVLHNAVIPKRNVKILQQRGTIVEHNRTHWISERSSQMFADFFTPQSPLSEGGNSLTEYLNPHDKRAMACMNRSSYDFFKQASLTEAERLYQKAMTYQGGNKSIQDNKQAVHCFCLAAEKGHVEAQFQLGVCYDTGRGVQKNPQQAVAYYQKAAQAGNSFAQNNLGVCYQHGLGVSPDLDKAVAYYQKASVQGHLSAKNNLNSLNK